MCVQLDLFSGGYLQETFGSPSESEFQEMALRSGISVEVAFRNPCISCAFKGLCDSDECAAHGFDLDCEDPYDSGEYLYNF